MITKEIAMTQPHELWHSFLKNADGTPMRVRSSGQHCAAMPGRHLGKRVAIKNLPPDVQKFVKQSF
jgi:hypothetical protein